MTMSADFDEAAETTAEAAEDSAEAEETTATDPAEVDGPDERLETAAATAEPAEEEESVGSDDSAASPSADEPEIEAQTEAQAEAGAEADATDAEDQAPEAAAAATSNGEPTDGVLADDEAEPVMPPSSPYDLPGSWYVVHSYSGYENKVKANLTTRISSMHMEDAIFDIVIPMEDVVEIKSGRKVTVPRKQFPGYVLVRMYLDDESWSVVRNTPGVTGFVGSGTKPTPLSRREVERILGVRKDEEKKTPRFKPDWEISETVRVIDGPFADFNGVIEDINVDQSKVRVLVDIFGRETPVELNFEQIQKF
jgi:transcription termination/antitermination protein NusG